MEMAVLQNNMLVLDLENDQVARDVAFTYAMRMIESYPQKVNELLNVIESYEGEDND